MPGVSTLFGTDRGKRLIVSAQTQKGNLATEANLPAATAGRYRRFNSYPGITFNQEEVARGENTVDGQPSGTDLGRTQPVHSGVQTALSPGELDLELQSLARNTITADSTAITQTSGDPAIGQVTVAVNVAGTLSTATFAGGGVLARGVRAGQLHEYSAGLAAADLGKQWEVVGATDTTIVYANLPDPLTNTARPMAAVATAADFSFVIKRHIIDGADANANHCPLLMEDQNVRADTSILAQWMKCVSMSLSINGRNEIVATLDYEGVEAVERDADAGHYFGTSFAATSNQPWTAPFASLFVDGIYVGSIEDISFQRQHSSFTPETTSRVAEDLGLGQFSQSGSFRVLESAQTIDFVRKALVDEYTSMTLRLDHPTIGTAAIAMPRNKVRSPASSGAGGDRFSSRTFNFVSERDTRGGAFAPTTALITYPAGTATTITL